MPSLISYFEDKRTFRGLTLWQPWGWCITHLPPDIAKRIENRDWRPWSGVRFIAIHAGSTYDKQSAEALSEELGIQVPSRGQISMKSITGVARLTGFVTESDDRWFVGKYGWQLADVLTLEKPIPFKGAQGLWEIPVNLRLQLGRQYCAKFEDRVDGPDLELRTGLQLRVPGL
jgi:hypothetical protein